MASGGSDKDPVLRDKMDTNKEATRNKNKTTRHRIHRSAVRPFFCCGSQLSLNSITEVKACSIEADPTDLDYDEINNEGDDLLGLKTLHIDTTVTVHGREKSSRKRASKIPGKKMGSMVDKRSGKNKFWTLKFKGKMQVSKGFRPDLQMVADKEENKCVCKSYKRSSSESDQEVSTGEIEGRQGANAVPSLDTRRPRTILDVLYPVDDIDDERIRQRRREMELGIDLDNVWVYRKESPACETSGQNTAASCSNSADGSVGQYPSYGAMGLLSEQPCVPSTLASSSSSLACPWVLQNAGASHPQQIHTQVDYIHYLVPDLDKIVNSSFYWGIMDRYQAEKVIENKPEGTFLLRDSAQEEFLFSVSFRRYGRSLHARIEQWNHNFSFDSRDPGVFATRSVCGLIDHYKDPSCCMFFEPMLTLPLHRTFPFTLQHLARATICSKTTYDGISKLSLPRALKEYLQAYHYKQKVRVRRFDNVA